MDIVEEIRNDPEKGARSLEAEYRAGLLTLARRLCRNDCDAEELVNRTFAEVIANIDSYAEQSAFFGWMSKILVNLNAKDIRRKSNERVVYPGELPELVDENAEEQIFHDVDASLLRDAIDKLPKEDKDVLLLHYFLDMPVTQMAKILLVPCGTIKSRLHHARKALAAKLGVAARKPGGKAVILALLLCGLTALGAGARLAVVRLLSSPSAAVEQQADNSNDAGQSDASNLSTFQPFNFSTSSNLPQSPSAATPSATDCYRPPATENSSLTTQGDTMNKTTLRTIAASAAFAAAGAGAPLTASAENFAGYATPVKTDLRNNESSSGGTDHYNSFLYVSDWNWPGAVPSSLDDAAVSSVDFAVPQGHYCYVNPGERAAFPGRVLAIEGWLYSKYPSPFNVGTARLLPGGGFRLNGANACFSGNVAVFGTASNPSKAYITAATANESTGFEFRNMTLTGAADSALQFRGNSSCKLGVFRWTGNGSGFLGTLQVDAKEMSASPAVSKLYLGDMTINGTVKVCDRSHLSLSGSSGVTVSNAIFEAGSTLAGVSASRRLTVAGSLTATAPVTIDLSSFAPPAAAGALVVVSFPASADVSGLDASAFTLAGGDDRVVCGGTLSLRDEAGGGKSLAVAFPAASQFVSRVSGVASDANSGVSEFDGATDGNGRAYWSDGNVPDAANATGKDYFSNGVSLVPPMSGSEIGVFHGASLTLENAMLQNGGGSGCAGFNVPDFRFAGDCGIKFWNSAGVWTPAFCDENGNQYRTFRLQGALDTGMGWHFLELYNEKHFLRVESDLSGSGDFQLRTYPSMVEVNCEAFFELAAFNTNWFGKIEVAGFGANYTANGGYKDYSGATLPNRTKRCRLFVADSRNLGGALSAFAYDALSLHHYGELFCRNDVTLEDGLNRGVSFGDFSTLFVTNGLTLAILRPATWNGCVFKTGGGTLALGGSLSFGGAAQSATPSENCNILAMEGGWLAPRTATAFDGLRMEFSNGSGISLTLRPEDASVAQYGLYDVKEEKPFAIIGGGTIPVAIDFSHENAPQRQHFSVAVATVRDDYAGVLKDILDFAPGSVPRAFNGEFRIRENGDGTSTVFASLSPAATFVVFR